MDTIPCIITHLKFNSSAKDSNHRLFEYAFYCLHGSDLDDRHKNIQCHVPLGAQARTTSR